MRHILFRLCHRRSRQLHQSSTRVGVACPPPICPDLFETTQHCRSIVTSTYNNISRPAHDDRPPSFLFNNKIQIRNFQNVGHYHNVADDTLHLIQDEVEALIEDNLNEDEDENIPELNYSDGVLTMNFPPHGTWVINKQTPNQQLWWSSPLSGPRRYEYDEDREKWVYTRVGGGSDSIESGGDGDTLGSILTREIKELYGWDLEMDA